MSGDRELPVIADVVHEMRRLNFDDRTRYLQALIGAPSTSPKLMQERALLVTALNEAELWPQRVKQ